MAEFKVKVEHIEVDCQPVCYVHVWSEIMEQWIPYSQATEACIKVIMREFSDDDSAERYPPGEYTLSTITPLTISDGMSADEVWDIINDILDSVKQASMSVDLGIYNEVKDYVSNTYGE